MKKIVLLVLLSCTGLFGIQKKDTKNTYGTVYKAVQLTKISTGASLLSCIFYFHRDSFLGTLEKFKQLCNMPASKSDVFISNFLLAGIYTSFFLIHDGIKKLKKLDNANQSNKDAYPLQNKMHFYIPSTIYSLATIAIGAGFISWMPTKIGTTLEYLEDKNIFFERILDLTMCFTIGHYLIKRGVKKFMKQLKKEKREKQVLAATK